MKYPNIYGLSPYRFSFTVHGKRHTWIRFYRDMEEGLEDCKYHANREYPLFAHAFMIESDQDDEEIRKTWGLPY